MAGFKLLKSLIVLLFVTILSACSEKELYVGGGDDGQNSGTDQYFGFETTASRSLYVDYGISGYKALIEVYAENPIELVNGNRVKKEGVEALFKAYTNENCIYNGDMSIPLDLKEVYLYTSYLGLPECVQLPVTDGKVSFDLPTLNKENISVTKAITRATADGSYQPYTVDKANAIYSLCKWGEYGKISDKGYVTDVYNEDLGNFLTRLQKTIGKAGNKKDNTKYLSSEELTNISISKKAADGTEIEKAAIDLIFLNERAGYQNTLGYYYYKTGTNPDIATLPKYIIFPNASIAWDDPYNSNRKNNVKYWGNAPLQPGSKVRLKFFGENYDEAANEHFLPGYTIGWFLISNAFADRNEVNVNKPIFYSNKSFNNGESRCMTLFDQRTQRMVVGFEDGDPNAHDRSYEDVLFYVESDPIKAIVDPEKPGVPSIDDNDDVVIPDETMTKSGTVAFEDLWPSQGDYDLNDVVLTYESTLTFNKDNKIVKVEDIFVPVNDGAGIQSSFGYQLDGIVAASIKMVTIDRPAWASVDASVGINNLELEQQYAVVRLYDDAKNGFTQGGYKGGKFKVTIEFNTDSNIDKSLLVPPYNPFIITDKASRKEVHLPKKTPTSLADMSPFGKNDDKSVPEKNLYYVSSNAYPFAIDIPTLNYKVPEEKVRIDVVYPKFNNWAATQGAEDSDWYK